MQPESQDINGPDFSSYHLALGDGDDDDNTSLPSYALAVEIEKLSGCVTFEPSSRRNSSLNFDSLHNLDDSDRRDKVTSQQTESTSAGAIVDSAQVPSSPPPDYEENFISAEAREEILRIISKHLNKITRRLK